MLSDHDLLHGEAQSLADYLGTTARTINRYKSGAQTLPEACRRLLRLRYGGDLAALMGKAWEGFGFGRDGLLYLPTYRNGFDPDQIRGMFFTIQECAALRAELRTLKSELWAMKKLRGVFKADAAVVKSSPQTKEKNK